MIAIAKVQTVGAEAMKAVSGKVGEWLEQLIQKSPNETAIDSVDKLDDYLKHL